MADQRLPVTGGCLCGAVRYQAAAPPTEGAFCHCSLCRRSTGGLFAALLRIPAGGFSIAGEPLRTYRSSAVARRSFCSACGAPLTFSYDGADDLWLVLGSLDHPEDWPMTVGAAWGPSCHTQFDSGVPWHAPADDGLPRRTGAFYRAEAEARLGSGGPTTAR